jgi:acyl-coenzyme A thioesterase PaaI-like protein
MFDAFPKTETLMPEGPAAAARLLEPALAQAAGPGVEPVSLTIDYGAVPAAGAAIVVEAGLERATRTLAFAHARLLTAEGVVVASGSAVFRRLTEITKAA